MGRGSEEILEGRQGRKSKLTRPLLFVWDSFSFEATRSTYQASFSRWEEAC